MPGLIAFLYGLGGGAASWGAVPQIVQAALGPSFVVHTLDYSAGLRSRADIETSAELILTKIQVEYPQHEPIYLGSGLIDYSQKMTTAAMHMADMNV
jgi:hypothetical protein